MMSYTDYDEIDSIDSMPSSISERSRLEPITTCPYQFENHKMIDHYEEYDASPEKADIEIVQKISKPTIKPQSIRSSQPKFESSVEFVFEHDKTDPFNNPNSYPYEKIRQMNNQNAFTAINYHQFQDQKTFQYPNNIEGIVSNPFTSISFSKSLQTQLVISSQPPSKPIFDAKSSYGDYPLQRSVTTSLQEKYWNKDSVFELYTSQQLEIFGKASEEKKQGGSPSNEEGPTVNWSPVKNDQIKDNWNPLKLGVKNIPNLRLDIIDPNGEIIRKESPVFSDLTSMLDLIPNPETPHVHISAQGFQPKRIDDSGLCPSPTPEIIYINSTVKELSMDPQPVSPVRTQKDFLHDSTVYYSPLSGPPEELSDKKSDIVPSPLKSFRQRILQMTNPSILEEKEPEDSPEQTMYRSCLDRTCRDSCDQLSLEKVSIQKQKYESDAFPVLLTVPNLPPPDLRKPLLQDQPKNYFLMKGAKGGVTNTFSSFRSPQSSLRTEQSFLSPIRDIGESVVNNEGSIAKFKSPCLQPVLSPQDEKVSAIYIHTLDEKDGQNLDSNIQKPTKPTFSLNYANFKKPTIKYLNCVHEILQNQPEFATLSSPTFKTASKSDTDSNWTKQFPTVSSKQLSTTRTEGTLNSNYHTARQALSFMEDSSIPNEKSKRFGGDNQIYEPIKIHETSFRVIQTNSYEERTFGSFREGSHLSEESRDTKRMIELDYQGPLPVIKEDTSLIYPQNISYPVHRATEPDEYSGSWNSYECYSEPIMIQEENMLENIQKRYCKSYENLATPFSLPKQTFVKSREIVFENNDHFRTTSGSHTQSVKDLRAHYYSSSKKSNIFKKERKESMQANIQLLVYQEYKRPNKKEHTPLSRKQNPLKETENQLKSKQFSSSHEKFHLNKSGKLKKDNHQDLVKPSSDISPYRIEGPYKPPSIIPRPLKSKSKKVISSFQGTSNKENQEWSKLNKKKSPINSGRGVQISIERKDSIRHLRNNQEEQESYYNHAEATSNSKYTKNSTHNKNLPDPKRVSSNLRSRVQNLDSKSQSEYKIL